MTRVNADDGLRDLPTRSRRDRRGLIVARLSYLPLVLLALAALVLGLLGAFLKAQPLSTDARVATAMDVLGLPAPAEPMLPPSCTPEVDQGLVGEPWLDAARRPASEAAFLERMALENPDYVQGVGDWVLWNDGQAQDFSQSLGRVLPDAAGYQAWSDYLHALQGAALGAGSSFYVVVAPAKWDVHPERSPEWSQSLRGTNAFDVLLASHPELPIIDTRAALRSAEYETYAPLNSHWTPYGATIAWNAIAECIRTANPGVGDIGSPEITGVRAEAGGNEYAAFGVPDAATPGWTVPEFAQPLPETTTVSAETGAPVVDNGAGEIGLDQLPTISTTPEAANDLTLLLLRDSTGSSLSPLVASDFGTVVQYPHEIGFPQPQYPAPAVIASTKPNVVLLVLTERYLAVGPPPLGVQ